MRSFAKILFLISLSIGALAVWQSLNPPPSGTDDSSTSNEDTPASQGFFSQLANDLQGWLKPQRGVDATTVSLRGVSITNPYLERGRKEMRGFRPFPVDFSSVSIEGKPLAKDDFLGRVLIVDIWATWCPPCRAEIPSFVELQSRYFDDGLSIVGMNYERAGSSRDAVNTINEFRRNQPINYPLFLGEDSLTEQIPRFRGFPTTLFIDARGNVRMMLVGAHPTEVLESYALILLAEIDQPAPAPSGSLPPRSLPKALKPGIGPSLQPQENPFALPHAI